MVTDADFKRLEELIRQMNNRLDAIDERLRTLSAKSISAPIASAASGGADESTEINRLKSRELQLQSELDSVKKLTDNSYTKEDVTEYFGAVINDFNEKTKTEDKDVDYIISNMEVDLKTQIYKDKELRMSGADISKTGGDGVSSVKISIKAVPKQTK